MDLNYQVKDLQLKNEKLASELRNKDAELVELHELLEAHTQLQTQDVQTAKIIELSKKNRTLTLALEKEKQRVAQLKSAAHTGDGGGAGAPQAVHPEVMEDIARSMVEEAAEQVEAASKEASMWKERHQQQTNKMSQVEQRAFALEIENKRMARALQREVGDDVPLAKVLEEGSDWKGRREQLIALRDQVKALKLAQGLAPESRSDAAAKKAIGKISGAKAAELERLAAELAVSRQEAESLRSKLEGAVSRRKILEAEISSMKDKVAVVLDKTQNDDRLIAALRAELTAAKRANSSAHAAGPRPDGDDEVWRELSGLRRRVGEQDSQIERQEQIILALQQRAATANPSTPPRSRDGDRGGGGLLGGSSSGQDAAQLRLAEAEISRLQELVRLLQRQLAAAKQRMAGAGLGVSFDEDSDTGDG